MMPFEPAPFPRWPEDGDLIRAGECRQDGTPVIHGGLPGIGPDTDARLTVCGAMPHIEAERREEDKRGRHRLRAAGVALPAAVLVAAAARGGDRHRGRPGRGRGDPHPGAGQGTGQEDRDQQGLTPTGGRPAAPGGGPRPPAGGCRTGQRVPWRTVPTFITGVLATIAVAVLVLCRGPARADTAVTDRLLRWWAGVWLRAAGARVAARGCEHLTCAAPCVVVSNHQSSLDPIVALRVLPVSLRVLAMRELFQVPLLGPAMRTIGTIEVDRQSPDFRRIDQAAARHLAAGHSLLAYPEGRISPDGAIGEFKDGAFIIAIANQVPVVPVAIHGTRRIWPPGRNAIRSGDVRIAAGSPLQTGGLTQRDIARLRDQARDVICTAHRDLVAAMKSGTS
jgi:1-acyl-sn-glycerol-3-phosphate acyltransferase